MTVEDCLEELAADTTTSEEPIEKQVPALRPSKVIDFAGHDASSACGAIQWDNASVCDTENEWISYWQNNSGLKVKWCGKRADSEG